MARVSFFCLFAIFGMCVGSVNGGLRYVRMPIPWHFRLAIIAGEIAAEKAGCLACEKWYNEDRLDTDWLQELNNEFPCPCTADKSQLPAGWELDGACGKYVVSHCWFFHPGAAFCLRSSESSASGAGQQCCYDDSGTLLPPDHSGAGTSDKFNPASDKGSHFRADVLPWFYCCKLCPQKCGNYKELRRISDECADDLPAASCVNCQSWYNEEITDTAWLDEVNTMFPCPCSVNKDDLQEGWELDPACGGLLDSILPDSWVSCEKYHPGAEFCIRSSECTPTDAGQQCCYDNTGNVLPADHPGAGTVDKAGTNCGWLGLPSNIFDHQTEDVDTWEMCCQECPDNCHLYKEVRKIDLQHCQN